MRNNIVMLLILLLLTGCTQQYSEDNKTNQQYLNLSTSHEDVGDVSKNSTKGIATEEHLLYQQDTNQQLHLEKETDLDSKKLPYSDFADRWNAVSEANYLDLYINDVIKGEKLNNDTTLFSTSLSSKIKMNIYVIDNEIQKIETVSGVNNQEDKITMLSCWQQMIQLLNPDIEIEDVDRFFNYIGVGPNADLSKVNSLTFKYHNLVYQLTVKENIYQFGIQHDSENEEEGEQ